MVAVGEGLAGDDVEVVDDGDAAQVEQVLAGAQVAGAASLPVADVGERMLDEHALAQLGAAGRCLLLRAKFPQEPLVGITHPRLLRHEDGMSDKAREKLGVLEQSARRMNEMIGTLLDFTRLRFHGSLPVVAEEIDLDELRAFAESRLAGYKRPRAYEIRDELPRTDSGKLLKRVLRDEYWRDRNTAV